MTKKRTCIRTRFLNILLLVSFIVTIMVPITGIHLHKLASTFFLLLCVIHTFVYRKKLGVKTVLLLVLIMISFLCGAFGMIFEEMEIIMQMHRAVSIGIVFSLAIHIFIYHKRLGLGREVL